MSQVAQYEWTHMYKGKPVGKIVRVLRSEISIKTGKPKKDDFMFYTPRADGGFDKGIPTHLTPRPLFGLDSAPDFSKPLLIVEGQKVQQALEGLGFQSVTSLGGASNPHMSDWDDVARHELIYFLPDKDDSGVAYVKKIWSILNDLPGERQYFFVTLPSLKRSGDLCDLLRQQPELRGWDEIESLRDHPDRETLAERVQGWLEEYRGDVPEDWNVVREWGAPEELDCKFRSVPPLSLDAMPEKLRARALDISSRMQCPIEYPAVSLIMMLGTIIGAACGIKPMEFNDGWIVVPNLWGFVVGEPGKLKTPAMNQALAPLEVLQAESKIAYEAEMLDYEAKLAKHEADVAGMKKARTAKVAAAGNTIKGDFTHKIAGDGELENKLREKPTAPKRRRLFTTDATVPKLVMMCAENPRGFLVFADEIASLFEVMKQEGRSADRPFYLSAWSGKQRVIYDRVDGGAREADNVCLSVFGSIQPGMLQNYLIAERSGSPDGFFQRFQMAVFPDEFQKQRDEHGKPIIVDKATDVDAAARVALIARELYVADFTHYGASIEETKTHSGDVIQKICYFRFDREAQKFMLKFLSELEDEKEKEDDPLMQVHLSKYASLMPSLALIFHLVEIVDPAKPGRGPVTLKAAMLAARWCYFLQEHARRIYRAGAPAASLLVTAIGKKIRSGKLGTRFTARDVRQKRWYLPGDPEAIGEALKELVEMDWLAVEPPREGAGRKTRWYLVNPSVYAGEGDAN